MLSRVFVCLILLAGVLAVPDAWQQQQKASPEEVLFLRFALRQQNIKQLENTLLDVSDPQSSNYGKWWSQSQILDLVAPPAAVSERVAEFLTMNGALRVQNQRDHLIVSMKVKNAESLLDTEFYNFVHKNGKSRVTRTPYGTYTLPADIADDIDLVSGVLEFPQIRVQRRQPATAAAKDGYVVPETLQATYSVPAAFKSHPNSSLCLAEFQDDNSYNKKDLKDFDTGTAIPNIDVAHVVGPYNGDTPDAESTLDVQYGGAVAVNTSLWFWTVAGWMYEFATDLFAAEEAPLVVSMSWGWPETEQCQIENCTSSENSEAYVVRLNQEFAKIGLRGISLLAASGDQGAPGDNNPNCDNSTTPLSTIFPGASPWVLSVGATMANPKSSSIADPMAVNPPVCKQFTCAAAVDEVVCTYPTALITTGGGFSNFAVRPQWQDTAVAAYLASGVKLPEAKFFNKTNRGFPDVSALGHNYLIDYQGSFQQVDGTSCSSPVVAGMVALLNSFRLNNGKAPLGFVAPLMYQAYASNAAIFKDITTGNNKCTEGCCDKNGYLATKGWDPVTGLGTPQFPALLTYVQSLTN